MIMSHAALDSGQALRCFLKADWLLAETSTTLLGIASKMQPLHASIDHREISKHKF